MQVAPSPTKTAVMAPLGATANGVRDAAHVSDIDAIDRTGGPHCGPTRRRPEMHRWVRLRCSAATNRARVPSFEGPRAPEEHTREERWMTWLDPIRPLGTPRVPRTPLGGCDVERPVVGRCPGGPPEPPDKQRRPLGGGQGRPPASARRALDHGRSRPETDRSDGRSPMASAPSKRAPERANRSAAEDTVFEVPITTDSTGPRPVRTQVDTVTQSTVSDSTLHPPGSRASAPPPRSEAARVQNPTVRVPTWDDATRPAAAGWPTWATSGSSKSTPEIRWAGPELSGAWHRADKDTEPGELRHGPGRPGSCWRPPPNHEAGKTQRPWDRALLPGSPRRRPREHSPHEPCGSPHTRTPTRHGLGSRPNPPGQGSLLPPVRDPESGTAKAQRRPEYARRDAASPGVASPPKAPIYPSGSADDGRSLLLVSTAEGGPPPGNLFPRGRITASSVAWTTAHRHADYTDGDSPPATGSSESTWRPVYPPDSSRTLWGPAHHAVPPRRHRPGEPSSGAMVPPPWVVSGYPPTPTRTERRRHGTAPAIGREARPRGPDTFPFPSMDAGRWCDHGGPPSGPPEDRLEWSGSGVPSLTGRGAPPTDFERGAGVNSSPVTPDERPASRRSMTHGPPPTRRWRPWAVAMAETRMMFRAARPMDDWIGRETAHHWLRINDASDDPGWSKRISLGDVYLPGERALNAPSGVSRHEADPPGVGPPMCSYGDAAETVVLDPSDRGPAHHEGHGLRPGSTVTRWTEPGPPGRRSPVVDPGRRCGHSSQEDGDHPGARCTEKGATRGPRQTDIKPPGGRPTGPPSGASPPTREAAVYPPGELRCVLSGEKAGWSPSRPDGEAAIYLPGVRNTCLPGERAGRSRSRGDGEAAPNVPGERKIYLPGEKAGEYIEGPPSPPWQEKCGQRRDRRPPDASRFGLWVTSWSADPEPGSEGSMNPLPPVAQAPLGQRRTPGWHRVPETIHNGGAPCGVEDRARMRHRGRRPKVPPSESTSPRRADEHSGSRGRTTAYSTVFRGVCAPRRYGGRPPYRFGNHCSMTRAIARRRQSKLHPDAPLRGRSLKHCVLIDQPIKGWGHRLAAPFGASQRCDRQEANSV